MRPLVNGILLWMLLPICAMAQQDHNLVPNPSFEEYTRCSGGGFGLSGWAVGWTVPDQGLTPDYFNTCSSVLAMSVPDNIFGYQYPVTGNAYMGIGVFENSGFVNAREGVTAELTETLKMGEKYVFSAYFSLADEVIYSIRSMGYRLSVSPLTGITPIVEYPPTYVNTDIALNDKENWMLLTDTVMAHGGERYLTISNFLPDTLSDTTFVGGVLWRRKAYYYIDDVSLIALDKVLSVEEHGSLYVGIYPNPATDRIALQSKEALETAWLTDLSGRKLWAFERRSDVLWETDIRELPQGIYLIEAIAEDGRRAVRKVVKM